MSTTSYIVGKRYWAKDGSACELLALVDDARFLIAKEIEFQEYDGDFSNQRGIPEITDRLFMSPPREVKDAEIARLDEQINDAKKHLSKLEDESRKAHREKLALEAELARFEPLKNLIAFMESRVEFVVYRDAETSGKLIKERYADWIKKRSHYGSMPVITITAAHGGQNIQWKASVVRSGKSTDLWVCGTEAEADEVIHKVTMDHLKSTFSVNNYGLWSYESAIRAAEANGVPVPREMSLKVLQMRLANVRDEQDKAAKATSDRAKAIADIEAQIAKLEGAAS